MSYPAQRVTVMHLVDTLDTGGAERLAVNLVNHLPRDRYCPVLCTTRRTGPLLESVRPDVGQIHLNRQARFEIGPVCRLVQWVREHRVRVLHAHGSTLFIARAVAMLRPETTVIWHAHYGRFATEDHAPLSFRIAARGTTVVAASREIASWVTRRLAPGRVIYLPNFVVEGAQPQHPFEVSGEPGFRVAIVANLRPEKDYVTLIQAFADVVRQIPRARLVVMGSFTNHAYSGKVAAEVDRLSLRRSVSFLGQRHDVASILKQCDVTVLTSVMEGLPMSLLEYGLAGRATVATKVGECPAVLDEGRVGLLVDPGSREGIASAIVRLLLDQACRERMGRLFRVHVESKYSASQAIRTISDLYDIILNQNQATQMEAAYDSGD